MDQVSRSLLAVGGSSFEQVYIEDVFSTYLYTTTGATFNVVNGIDLSGKGGLVWVKQRLSASNHGFTDTVRGGGNFVSSNATAANSSGGSFTTAFNNNGFATNAATNAFVSWTFRKQPKFFDVLTYTGNGANRTVAHSLGSVPGCIFIKRTDTTSDWQVYHRSLANTEYLVLNGTAAKATGATRWNSTTPTSTDFSLGTDATVNASGGSYVAYIFAHDAGGFGSTGNDNVISCGSFTTDVSGNASVSLGYEPQFLLFKKVSNIGSWNVYDTMRGVSSGSYAILTANTSNAESSGTWTDSLIPTATGFTTSGTLAVDASSTYIYLAIRRGLMRTPTDATKVFYPEAVAQANTIDSTGVPFPPDLVNTFTRNGTSRTVSSNRFNFVDRLRGIGIPNNTFSAGGGLLSSAYTDAENLSATASYVQLKADGQNITRTTGWGTATYGNWIYYFFRRAPGFFDVALVPLGGSRTHNLGVVPELIIGKRRDIAQNWVVGSGLIGWDKAMYLNLTNAAGSESLWGGGSSNPTSSFFYWGGGTSVHYLFASCPGVSKVGTYTGNDSSQTINCGFTTGARFILIKRTDSAGDWYVWDTARGIVAANDPHLSLNTTVAEVTTNDSIDPDNSGFIVNQVAATNINVNNATYLYLAIA